MKKFVFITLSLIMMAGLVACKKDKPGGTDSNSNEFKISITDIKDKSAKVSIECLKSQDMPYFWTAVTAADFESKYSSDAAKLVEEALTEDKQVADITVKGKTEKELDGLVSETEYVVVAVSVFPDGKTGKDQKVEKFTTLKTEIPTSEMKFEFNFPLVSETDIVLEVQPSVTTDSYYFGLVKSSEYTDAKAEVEKYVTDFMSNNPDAKREDALRMAIRKGKVSNSYTGLSEETEYTAYAIGLTEEGYYTTAEATAKVTTKQKALTFQLPTLDITSTSAHIYYKPSNKEARYYASYMAESVYYSECDGTADGIGQYVQKKLSEMIEESGLEKVLNENCKTGNTDEVAEGLEPETKYYIYAVGVDDEGKIIGTPATDYFLTKADQIFNFEIQTITENSIDYKITTNDANASYYTSYITEEEFTAKGEEAIIENVKANLETAKANLKTGTTFNSIKDLENGTKYRIYAVGLDENGTITSSASHTMAETKESAIVFTIEITANGQGVNQYGNPYAEFTFTPSDNNYTYSPNCVAVEDLDGAPSQETIMEAYMNFLNSKIDGNYYPDLESVLRYRLETGVYTKQFTGKDNQMSPMVKGKKYCAFAVGMDRQGNQTSELVWVEFTLTGE